MKLIQLLKEIKINQPNYININYCWIDSHSDYHSINLASKKDFEKYLQEMAEDNETTVDVVKTWEFTRFLEEVPRSPIIFIDWNDEGPNSNMKSC